MGLKRSISNISTATAEEIAKVLGPSLINQIQQTATPYTTQVVRVISSTEYVVKDHLGNEKTITYIGDRPIGAKSTILINGDYAM